MSIPDVSNQGIVPAVPPLNEDVTELEDLKLKGTREKTSLPTSEEVNLKAAMDARKAEFDKIVSELTLNTSHLKGSVLNRIIRLLTELLPILQHIGTAQAGQLDLPTKMQALYTELISKAPVYRKDAPTFPENRQFSKDDEKDAQLRNEANQRVSIWTDTLRSYRSVWENVSKKNQSLINTTTEAVNQQIDLLTTFLQQLRELVSLITRIKAN